MAKEWGNKMCQVYPSPAAALEGGSGCMATAQVGKNCSKFFEGGLKEEDGGRREPGAGWKEETKTDWYSEDGTQNVLPWILC